MRGIHYFCVSRVSPFPEVFFGNRRDFLFVKKLPTYNKFSFLLFFVMLIVAACSTTKNTFVTRTYHNINARYNGYFYARESMKDANEKVERGYLDDYSQLLPLFRLPNTPETKGSFTDLEKAIKKSTMVIERHAITNSKGVEVAGAVKWIDDTYLIIGQAHYYKGEYITALEIFDYMIQKYPNMEIRNDAILWKARTQVELGAYTAAESLLDMIAKKAPERLQGDIKATYADLYMRTGNYANAIKFLEEAIPLTKKKKTLARYTFVLAQLYEKVGKEKEAFVQYGKVIDMHPQYDMLFNAKLNRARLSASDSKNRNASKKELQKMLSDGKNTEYQDQIYYTLAQLEMGAKNKTGAINYYRQSVGASVGNNKQKALSYLALGDIYFADTDYETAQAYYDSTMTVLPKDFQGYKAISEKHKSLANLVRYINIVQLEDSLQMVAKTYGGDTTTLYPYIDNLIKKAQEEEQRKKEQLEQQMATGGGGTGLGQTGNGPQPAGAWYFYNPSTIAFGVNEFTRKWGNRKPEDNWRRANKEAVFVEDDGETPDDTAGVAGGTGKGKVKSKFSRDYYIKPLPLTAEKMAQSDEKIADALYNLGTLYKEQMNNNTKAIDAFEQLCARYPNHKYALPSHFQLWRIYNATKNNTKADEHKNYICGKFPKSEYCELIKNPDAVSEHMQERAQVEAYYTETYEAYVKRDYVNVIARANYADTAFGKKNEHAAQFAYLRAVSLGKTQGTPAMESELTKIIANYPKDPIRAQAQALLDLIHRQNGGTTNVAPKDSVTGPAYVYNENVEYQYMVVVETAKADLNKFRIAISDFNAQMFASQGLTISSFVIDPAHQVITVKKFANKTAAMSYYNLLKSKPEIFMHLQPGSFQAMVISTENFTLFFKDKNVAAYKTFFDKNILKK